VSRFQSGVLKELVRFNRNQKNKEGARNERNLVRLPGKARYSRRGGRKREGGRRGAGILKGTDVGFGNVFGTWHCNGKGVLNFGNEMPAAQSRK